MNRKSLLFRAAFTALFVFSLTLLGGHVMAQVTSSSINGQVTDSKGELLPGATVVAVHEASGTQYGTVTTEAGRYAFPSVRVGGPYKVTVTFIGYGEKSVNNIFTVLGNPSTVNIVLADEGTQLTEVVITGGAGQAFNAERTGAATSVNSEQLRSLPTVTRSISDFTRLTPQANGSSFGGRDGRYNNFQVDGANFNNGFGLNDNPLPGGGGLSLDAIEEIQVNIAPFDVRQSGFSGAGINAITRSGTNKFSGSAYGFFANEKLQGAKVNGNDLQVKPDGTSQTVGFRLAGPLIKNKLFFFVNAEQIKKTGANVGATNLWRASENGVANADNNITRVRRSDMEAVRNHLINQWGYDPGTYEGYANDNSEKTTSILARIDWNINSKNKLAVRYNQVESSAPSLVNGTSGAYPRSSSAFSRVSQNSMAFSKTMYETKNIVRSVTAELNSELTPKLSNQFLATYSRIQATRSSPSEEFPMIDIGFSGDNLNPAGTVYQNYITAGYELFTYGNDVLNDNFNFVNNLTLITGRHTFTGGISFETQKFGNRYIRNGTSYYRYASVEDFLLTGTPQEKAPIQFALTYPYEGQDPYAPIRYGLPSIYIQDKFDVNDRLTITAGIRAEMPIFMNDLTRNPSVDTLSLLGLNGRVRNYDTGSWPKTRVMLSPRVGFRWDVKGDKSLVLRGGTGIFAGRVPFVWLTNMPSNLGVIQNTVEPGSYAASAPWIGDIRFNPDKYYWLNNTPASAQNVFIKNPRAGLPGTVALIDENFKMPQIWRSSFGVDYKIPGTPFALTGDFMYTKDIQAVYQFGANRKAATATMNYSGDNREFYPNATSYTYNNKVGANAVSVLTNTSKGYSLNATIGLTMAARRGFYGSLFYSHTTAKTTTDNNGSAALSAWGATPNINNPNDLNLYSSDGALPSRLVGTLSYRVEYANHLASTFSLFYNGANQGRFSYTYNGDFNGDAIGADLFYVPNSASELRFTSVTAGSNQNNNLVTFTPEQQAAAFDAYINGNEYLSSKKGKYVDRNANLMPWLNRFDFKFLQDIYTNIGKNRHTLQLSLDVINVGNLLNSGWGVRQELIATSNTPLRRASVTADGIPTVTLTPVQVDGKFQLPTTQFRDITTTATTWSMLVGVRYLF